MNRLNLLSKILCLLISWTLLEPTPARAQAKQRPLSEGEKQLLTSLRATLIELRQGHIDQASHRLEILRQRFGDAEVFYQIAAVLHACQHNYARALDDCARVLTFRYASRQGSVTAYEIRGAIYATMKKFPDSRADYERAINLDPMDSSSLDSLAWLLATCPDPHFRDGPLALKEAQKAVKLEQTPDAGLLDTLDAAEAEVGHFKEAVQHERRSLSSAPAAYRGEMLARLRQYQNGTPHRDDFDFDGAKIGAVLLEGLPQAQ